jgi:hypothetical protein
MFCRPGGAGKRGGEGFSDPLYRTRGDGRFLCFLYVIKGKVVPVPN